MLHRFGLVQVTLVSPRWASISSAPTQRRRARTHAACAPHAASQPLPLPPPRLCVGSTAPPLRPPSAAATPPSPPTKSAAAAAPACDGDTVRRPPDPLARSPREDSSPPPRPIRPRPSASVLDLTGLRLSVPCPSRSPYPSPRAPVQSPIPFRLLLNWRGADKIRPDAVPVAGTGCAKMMLD